MNGARRGIARTTGILRIGLLAAAAAGAGTPPALAAEAGFTVREIAGIAPGQPRDAFFGECPSLAHRGGTTWFVYADDAFDVFVKAYDHAAQTLSGASPVGAGWNDHINPALLIGGDGYLHVLYGARPLPLRYHRSNAPLDHTGWSAYEQVGASATYPVPYILGDRLFVIYREGNSYFASLSCAVRELGVPVGTPGAWTVRTLVEGSSVFVPMPLAAFESGGRVCFLFNMRDALLSSPHTQVVPSVREGMAIVCTADGAIFSDIGGSLLSLPLDYTGDRARFPEVTMRETYVDAGLDGGTPGSATGGLRHDGSIVQLTLTPAAYARAEILMGDSTRCSCRVELTAGGSIVLSDADARTTIAAYTPGRAYELRLKFHFSAGLYRPWLDGALAGAPLDLSIPDPPPAGELSIDSVAALEQGGCGIGLLTGREYKLMTASACPDAGGGTDLFFIDRMDSSERSRWRLMHQRGETVSEIGDSTCHQYHASSIRLGDLVLVATAYFEGEGLFLNNEHLTESSRIMLLGSADLRRWDEVELAAGSGGHVHPIFKRSGEGGPVELVWARMESASSTVLMHGFSGPTAGASPGPVRDIVLRGLPNPFSSSAVIRFALPAPGPVDIGIYDCAGRLVRRLIERETMAAGDHDIPWDGCSDSGAPVAPGVYLVRAGSGAGVRTAKIVLIR